MFVLPRQVDGAAKVADCGAAETPPIPMRSLGFATFSAGGTTPGCNPCEEICFLIDPVFPTTWSSIKAIRH
jgi:hypothetical protein